VTRPRCAVCGTALDNAHSRCPTCSNGASDANSPKRKRKRARRGPLGGYLPIVLAAAGGVCLLLCVGVIGIIALGVAGWADRGPAVARQEGPAEGAKEERAAAANQNFVVFDEVRDAEGAAAKEPAPVIVAAPAAGPPTAPPPPQPIVDEAPADAVKPAWNIAADGRPAAPALQYPAGWKARLETARAANHFLIKFLPLLADMDGPFALLFPPDDRTRSINRDGTPPGEGFPPPPVVDLRTGKEVGTFSALSPYWRDARLSPTGEYLVGPDSGKDCLLRPERNTLFVWKRGAAGFDRKLALPGSIAWLEFVAADHLAVLVFDKSYSLQIWDVAGGKALQRIDLTAEQFPAPGAGLAIPDRQLHTFYRPWPLMGAVSPGGRHVALGNRAGITLVDVREGKEIGTLPIPEMKNEQASAVRGVSFQADGKELYALVFQASKPQRLLSWSVADGLRLLDLELETAEPLGPPLLGPEPGTILLPGGHVGFGIPNAYNYVPPYRASRVMPAMLIETRVGSVLAKLDYCVLRWAENGPVVAAGGPAKSDPQARPEDKWDAGVPQEMFAAVVDRPALIAAAKARAANLAARPGVVRPDRLAVQRITPEPPAAWAAPPVSKSEPAAVRYLETAFPTAWAEAQVAMLRYNYERDVRERFELFWDRHDRRSGAKIGTSMRLWPWTRDPGKMKPHEPGVLAPAAPVAALSADGGMLAVRDPADPSRVDLWSADGRRLVGFHPAGRTHVVHWLGWSPRGRLLTVANGSVSAWEMPAGRAEFTAAGGYTAPVAPAADRSWVAVAAGDHVDLLDSATGTCLARCRAGGGTGPLRDLTPSPDGRRLAVVFASADPKAGKYTAQLWDLTAGKADLLTFGGEPYQTCCWVGPEHFAAFTTDLVLYDLAVRHHVAAYHVPIAPPKWHGPVFARSSDGRLWFHRGDPRPQGGKQSAGGAWWAVADAELLGAHEGHQLGATPRAVVIPRRFPVRVEADLGSSERSRQFAPQAAELLRKAGFATGPKGWSLRIAHRAVETSKELKLQGLIEVPEFIPAVVLDWALCDADGNHVWERRTVGNFAWNRSKYFTGTTTEDVKGRRDLQWVKTHFNFKGRNMRDAIVEEILDTLAQEQPVALGELPNAYLKIDRRYLAIPLRFNPIAAWSAAGNAPPGR
jgi:hypothetical protein